MKPIFAEVITIGDEILYGQIMDTNTHWISGQLDLLGIKVKQKTSVGDNLDEIQLAFAAASKRADLIVCTGGLGPTKDDITKKAFTEFFKCDLVLNVGVLAHLKQMFEKRGRELSETNKQQAFIPENAEVLINEYGTAPGMWIASGKNVFVSMPGVPGEMKGIFKEQAIPKIKALFELPVILHKMIKTVGVAEAQISETIEAWELALPANIKLAYLPHFAKIRLRLTAFGDSLEELEKQVESQTEKLLPMLQPAVYGFGDEELEGVIGQILIGRGETLAVAESCTGGNIAAQITAMPGCSAFFKGGVVAYSNDVKTAVLGVSESTLAAHGAVSEQTVKEMADGARKRLGATYGIATTGVAGPGGGSPEKPVGTVWIAFSSAERTVARLLKLMPVREFNIQVASNLALELLRRNLLRLADY